MNSNLEAASTAGAVLSAPHLRPARFEDYEGIARLWAAQSWVIEPPEEWLHFWLGNPACSHAGDRWPIGWVLETARGEIVGTFTNIPSLYTYRGQELLAANSRGWTFLPAYRGYALWVIEEYYNQASDVCISTSTGPNAVGMIDRIATRIPLGDWESGSYRILSYERRVENRLARYRIPGARLLAVPCAAALRLRERFRHKSLLKLPAGFTIETCECFDVRFDTFWRDLVNQNPEKLLANRSRESLSWHYAIPMKAGRTRIFTVLRRGSLRAYCVLLIRRDRETTYFIDYQTLEPEFDLLGGLLRTASQHCEAEGLCEFHNLGTGVPKMQALDLCMPHRKRLESWRFFYHSTNRELWSALQDPGRWDPSAFDGDSSLT